MSVKTRPDCDREMLQRPGEWPCWPALPLIVRGRDFKQNRYGVLFDEPRDKGWRVFLCLLYELGMPAEEFAKVAHQDYPTVDALLADGWVVD